MLKAYLRKEQAIVLSIIIGAIVLANLPMLVGFLIGGNSHFTGGNYLNSGDTSVYISYIEQAKEGKFLMSNLFTSENQRDVFFAPLWLVLGLLARVFN
jgi:hypothetical protein